MPAGERSAFPEGRLLPIWSPLGHAPEAPLPPALEINPIGAAHRPTSRLASLGLSVLVWGLVAGLSVLGYRLQATRRAAASPKGPAVDILLEAPDDPNPDAGGHQGGGLAALAVKAPEPEMPPPPPPPRDLPEDLPTPATLPVAPVAPPPQATSVAGVPGGTGTGSGFGTGSGHGAGTGTGTGTGAGQGNGNGVQPLEPILVPYSQIGFVKMIQPAYPEHARRVGLEGQVVIRVTIDESGAPVNLHVVAGESLFVKECLRVLPHWRFTPVYHLGNKVRATFDAVLHFKLA